MLTVQNILQTTAHMQDEHESSLHSIICNADLGLALAHDHNLSLMAHQHTLRVSFRLSRARRAGPPEQAQ